MRAGAVVYLDDNGMLYVAHPKVVPPSSILEVVGVVTEPCNKGEEVSYCDDVDTIINALNRGALN